MFTYIINCFSNDDDKNYTNKVMILSSELNIHLYRVRQLANILCRELDLTNKEKESILISAELHDIGKIVIDTNILNKADKLDKIEWDFMKKHSKFGYMIAKSMGHSEIICNNILYHHEDYNGNGYPHGLKGDNIPLGARVIRICDSYDAIRSKRSYKGKRGHSETIEEMIKSKENYDEDILNKFLDVRFDSINNL